VRSARAVAFALSCALAAAFTGCKKPAPAAGGELRLGFFPNLTHAQALVGQSEDLFAKQLGARVTVRQFNAGPAAMEALMAGDLDVAYVGPGPAAIAYLRSHGEALKVVAGAVSGGAELIVRSARAPGDLAGKRVASPQLGNTQDIALRFWLRGQGLPIGDGPQAVQVVPLANADIMALFGRGELEAAWVPEPWGARLRAEAGGRVLIDERDLWEGRQFPTTVVVASRRALASRRSDVAAILRAHVALTDRWKSDPAGFARAANAAFGKITGRPLPEPVLQDAFAHLEPTVKTLEAQLVQGARHAQELQFAPPGDLTGIVDGSVLDQVRAAALR
jgi:NitT/TauT family transport system substrate-binding protein